MKNLTKLYLLISLLAISLSTLSQAPEGINYQATVRDNSGNLMTSQSVTVIFAIRQTSTIGTVIYQETHSVTTNNYGGFTAIIGGGTATSGTFSSINWSASSHYLNVRVNGNDLGTTQLISVPYALYAKTSGSSTPGPAGPTGATGSQGPAGVAGATGAQGATGLQGPAGVAGPQGNQGPTGPQGPTGTNGINGTNGTNGTAGKTILNGTSAPTAQGTIGDFYINTVTNLLYGPKTTGGWGIGLSLVGPTGVTGPQGPSGATGAVGPAGIAGPQGSQGPTGATGPTGPAGTNGVNGTNGAVGPQGPAGPPASDDQDIDSVTLTGDILEVYIHNGASANVSLSNISHWEKNGDDFRIKNGNYDSANFLFGSPQVDSDGSLTHANRMFFYQKKGAFRAGSSTVDNWGLVSTPNWDKDSLGDFSFASGNGTLAIGNSSTAMGYWTKGKGDYSVAMGYQTVASGLSALATGRETEASGQYSSAFGTETIASGDNSTSMGWRTRGIGNNSTAMGNHTRAIGYSATSMGNYTRATASQSTAMGNNTYANTTNSTAMGVFNDTTSYGLIFSIGNGSYSSRENSMHIFQATNNTYFRGHVSPTVHNTVSLGRPANRWSTIYATNGTIQTSDTTLKTNIQPLSYGLADLMKIQTITYDWKDDTYGVKKIGFNAQNLLQIIPEVVQTHSAHINEGTGEVTYKKNDKLGVYYSDMIPVLTKSIQEQQKIIEMEKVKNEDLGNKVKSHQKELETLRKEIEELKKSLQNEIEKQE